jgi:hypothetical protein
MDFSMSREQDELLRTVDRVINVAGGPSAAAQVATALGFDYSLEHQLSVEIDFEHLTLLDKALIADRLAEAGAATTIAVRSIVLGGVEVRGPLAVVHRDRSGPVRYAQQATSALVINDQSASLVQLEPGTVAELQGGSGYPIGRIPEHLLDGGVVVGGAETEYRWGLALAAEIAGLSAAAIGMTAEHLQLRKQFGKPLSHFQALRHRVAELAVTAEATRWLVREAAFTGNPRSMALAASYAAAGAARLSPELVQLWGARGFAHEFGISTFAMRLQGLRLELGSADRLTLAVLDAPDIARTTLPKELAF